MLTKISKFMFKEVPYLASKTEEFREKENFFPKKVEDIKESVYLGGSSGVRAGIYKGETFVVKKARKSEPVEGESNTDQIKEEYIAEQIYKAMGFAVPQSRVYDNGLHKVSKFVDGKDLRVFKAESGYGGEPEKYKGIKEQVKKGYVLDALLANWDVVGQIEDNIRLGDDGEVYRMDSGGALRFRARGGV